MNRDDNILPEFDFTTEPYPAMTAIPTMEYKALVRERDDLRKALQDIVEAIVEFVDAIDALGVPLPREIQTKITTIRLGMAALKMQGESNGK